MTELDRWRQIKQHLVDAESLLIAMHGALAGHIHGILARIINLVSERIEQLEGTRP
jgi:hypothetical protein